VLGEALYDRRTDPGERRPLTPGERLDHLRRYTLLALERARADVAQPASAELSEELRQELKALGYID
jgi:hypothetical protein